MAVRTRNRTLTNRPTTFQSFPGLPVLRVLRLAGVRPRQLRLPFGHAARPGEGAHGAGEEAVGAGTRGHGAAAEPAEPERRQRRRDGRCCCWRRREWWRRGDVGGGGGGDEPHLVVRRRRRNSWLCAGEKI